MHLWQWVEGHINWFGLLFGRALFPLRGRKLCHMVPSFPLYSEGEGMDQYSTGVFKCGLWAFGLNHFAAVKCWEARSWSQKKMYSRSHI